MKLPLCLGVFVILVLGAHAQTDFPYCPCQRVSKGAPYSWSLKSKKTSGGATTYCYTVTATKYTGAPGASCVNYDLRKIELDIKPECDGDISSITFNGDDLARSTQKFGSYGVTTKFTRGGGKILASFDSILAKPAEVCYTLSGTCNTEEKFCTSSPCKVTFFDPKIKCCPESASPSPPPPRKPKAPKAPRAPRSPAAPSPRAESAFPYCPCLRTAQGPYTVTKSGSSTVDGLNKYCFTVTATKQTSGKYCSSFDLRKVEWDIVPDCQGAVAELTVNGDSLAPTYQNWKSQGGVTLKAVRPNSGKNNLVAEADLYGKSLEVCFVLRKGTCGTLSSFCKGGYCLVSTFSPNNKCCPVSFLSI